MSLKAPEKMAEAPVGSEKVTVFRQKGSVTYRIPALLYLPLESTFLAFAEERSSPRDEDAKFLVMRRGQREGTSVKWSPQELLSTASLPKYRTMNPCPIYEVMNSTVFLFFICVLDHITTQQQILTSRNAARLGYIFSKDAGRTWSPMIDLTEQVIGDNLRNWATFAVGPGHGVQLSSGRLVIPAYACCIQRHCLGHPLFCCTKPHSFTFYSDDGGQTWLKGQLLKTLQASECQIAELVDQNNSLVLYCNARSSDKYRVEAFSRDGGCFFEDSFQSPKLQETSHGCQGSVVSFPPLELGAKSPLASSKSPKSWLIFSHPTNPKKRVDLGIYLNTCPMQRDSWNCPWVLHQGPSGYSDLAVCQGEDSLFFGCLFECGESLSYEEIAFQFFSDAELLKTQDEYSAGKNPPPRGHAHACGTN
ncbi:sialidase-3-like [Python bivittatus]|uniref:exo-alpha-sialidase n=1 Tax=Python bivittatus TaxID=176946 RepID=A0A9F3QSK9_PYTBI|nr:sialidase-3-like [Python bivittatus]XP_007435404.1 sialidase-3-like [Python bivittatus]XP_015744795.1 sialidase-3-like [Python bivittatus]XP_025027035.1 sialidase-3-like [Python bivittatus]